MKLLLITFMLSTLASSVTGQLMTMAMDTSAVAPMDAPEMVIYYVNEKASSTVCTAKELLYIDSKMLPDMSMTLLENNYATPDWQVTSGSPLVRRRQLPNFNCDFCKRLYPRNMCNEIYNCGFRRRLRGDNVPSLSEARELGTNEELEKDLIEDCQTNIAALAYNKFLTRSCRIAASAATCHVEFV